MDWIELDKQWLLAVNGSDSVFLDSLVKTLTTATTWIPLYVALLYVVVKNSDSMKKVFLILGCAFLCVFLAGSLDDMIVKPLVARWRPARDPDIGIAVDIVNGYRGGRFGFFSAHASNTFSLAAIWSLVNCWTRMYLGVHYPGDIIVGLLWGAFVGSGVWMVYNKIEHQALAPANYVSSQYTKTGYLRSHADIPVCILVITLIYALITACFIQ